MKRLLLWIALGATVALAQNGNSGEPAFVMISAADGQGLGFLISTTEVTFAQFEAFTIATGYRTHAEREESARNWRSPGFDVFPSQPVTYVTPRDAAAYCAWIGGRLPTDAEWERAARAGTNTRHYWGDVIDPGYLWYRPNSEDRPQAVGGKRPNAYGLYDIEGNVWEWTLPNEAIGAETLANRRGGSWVSCETIPGSGDAEPPLRIGIDKYYRVPVKLNHRYDDIGFRCAKDATSDASTAP